MEKLISKNGIIFDLDGTLWDAINEIMDARNIAMNKNSLQYHFTFEKTKSYMGLTPEETVPLAFNDVDFDKGLTYFKLALKEEIEYLKDHPGEIYPNEKEILTRLKKKYPLFIVSNSDKGYIENYLNSLNMNEFFIDHLCAGDTKKAKWENILIMKEKYNLDKVIYVGDTLKDYIETKKAGQIFIHASYGFGIIDENVNKITNLKELPKLVDELFNI